jgi:hypothetical protein
MQDVERFEQYTGMSHLRNIDRCVNDAQIESDNIVATGSVNKHARCPLLNLPDLKTFMLYGVRPLRILPLYIRNTLVAQGHQSDFHCRDPSISDSQILRSADGSHGVLLASIRNKVRVLLLVYLGLSTRRVILLGSDVIHGHGMKGASDLLLWNDISQPSDMFPLEGTIQL